MLGVLALDGGDLAVRRRERVLLALLALEAGRPVGLAAIEDWLWPGGAGDHRRQLQVSASRLRKALRDHGESAELVSHGAAYELQAGPDDLDAVRARHLLARADELEGDDRLALLDEALGLWRGPVLADLPELGLHPGLAELVALGLAVRERWAAAALEAGQAERVATVLAADDLLELGSEAAVGHLVLALYRSGRPLDALATCHRYAARLRDERGLDPGPELQALELGLLTHDGSLNPPTATSGPAAPGPLVEVRRRLADEAGQEADLVQRAWVAAEEARRGHSYAEARLHLEQALGHCPPDDDATRFELLAGLADVRRRLADEGYRDLLVEMDGLADRASGSTAVDRRVRTALAQREVGWHGLCGEPEPDLEAYERAREPLDRQDPRWAVLTADMAAVVHHTALDARRTAWYEAALAAARQHGDDATLRRVLADAIVLDEPGQSARRAALAAELVERAEAAGDLEQEHLGSRIALLAALDQGDLAVLEQSWRTMARTAEELRQPAYRWAALAWSASVELHCGRLHSAEERAHRAYTLGIEGGLGETRATWLFSGQLGELRRLQGRFGELLPMIEAAVVDEVDHHPYAPWRAALPLALVEAGRHREATAGLAQVMAERHPFALGQAWGTEALCAAEVAAVLGDAGTARKVYEAVVDRAGSWASSGAAGAGPVATTLGIAAATFGDDEAASAHLASAVDAAHRAGAPVYEAQARAQLARVLARSADPDDRRRAADEAAAARAEGAWRGAGLVVRLADEVLATG